ncbi:MAG: response regulator [Verrucomicrobiae bacterium]|nr:response regulator [Verrucomicrobiae bacterium]
MKQKSILLVDDEVVILNSLSRELNVTHPNFEVHVANSGKEAIDRINSQTFDLVVTDLFMPGVDGFQVLKSVKLKDPQTMVIILTGYADLQSSIDALRLGADDFLQKPCDIDELLYRISNCFVKQDLQRKVQFYETILPVCSYCKKIRDDNQGSPGNGIWYELEEYLHHVHKVNVSHGCCPACYAQMKKKLQNQLDQDRQPEEKPRS